MQQEYPEILRLVAQDEADIEVVSALLQDAIIAGSDMYFDTQNACFLIVANRFCWERPALADVNASCGGAVHERALCGLRINHVVDVQKRHWPTDWHTAFFNILALKPVAVSQQGEGCVMEFSFSGGPSLRLFTQQINLVLGDLDDGRPTNLQPRHDI